MFIFSCQIKELDEEFSASSGNQASVPFLKSSCSAVSSTGFGISLHIILAARLSLTWEEMRRYGIKWENFDLRIGGFSKFEYKVNLSYLVGTARLLVLGRQGRERGLIGYYLPFVPKAVLLTCACVVCVVIGYVVVVVVTWHLLVIPSSSSKCWHAGSSYLCCYQHLFPHILSKFPSICLPPLSFFSEHTIVYSCWMLDLDL